MSHTEDSLYRFADARFFTSWQLNNIERNNCRNDTYADYGTHGSDKCPDEAAFGWEPAAAVYNKTQQELIWDKQHGDARRVNSQEVSGSSRNH